MMNKLQDTKNMKIKSLLNKKYFKNVKLLSFISIWEWIWDLGILFIQQFIYSCFNFSYCLLCKRGLCEFSMSDGIFEQSLGREKLLASMQ